MEVLNKNQRESAIWRLVGLGLLVLIVNAVILLATHKAYANQGCKDEDELRKQLKDCSNTAQGKQQDLQNKLKALEVEHTTLKTESINFKNEKSQMQSKIEDWKERYDILDKALTRCEAKLAASGGG